MRLEILYPTYEGPTLENDETQISDTIKTEEVARLAGKMAATLVLTHGYVMPGAEIATLDATLALVEVPDTIEQGKNAQNN
jgi:hypothetical protein